MKQIKVLRIANPEEKNIILTVTIDEKNKKDKYSTLFEIVEMGEYGTNLGFVRNGIVCFKFSDTMFLKYGTWKRKEYHDLMSRIQTYGRLRGYKVNFKTSSF